MSMSEMHYQPRKVTCTVCGATSQIHKTGICVDTPLFGPTSYWDYMDCPMCGCQILLRKRLVDVDDLMEATE